MKFALNMLAAAALATAAAPLAAQAVSRIAFERGNDNAAVEGTIKGREFHDYKLTVGQGQNLGVSLITEGSAYFNILPPGSDGVAVYNSSIDGQDATGIETVKGDYTIRVYLMGAAERSSAPVKYMVSVSVL